MSSEETVVKKKPNLRLGAWLPWLPLLIIGVAMVMRTRGVSGYLAVLFGYILISFLIGAVVVFLYRKDRVAKTIAASILFGGPLLAYTFEKVEMSYQILGERKAQALLSEYCTEQAGAIVYRTAKDVEGLLEMEYREQHSLKNSTKNGVPDPWIQFSSDAMKNNSLRAFGQGYFFLEERAGVSEKNAISRTYLFVPEDLSRDSLLNPPLWKAAKKLLKKTVVDDSVMSKYGWRARNITTEKMRKNWISGGTIEIVDLENSEVMGSLTSFYLGRGSSTRTGAWGVSFVPGKQCGDVPLFVSFVREVLLPPAGLPSVKLIQSLDAS